jgi:RHS repeat-associated protein
VWGKRRDTVDHASVSDNIDGKVDNKDFTNHEMLDQLDLMHMNGRVYDPLLGKFLSGDPMVTDPNNGQNYNRYSYALNNPTNLTDPTGFEPGEVAYGVLNLTPREQAIWLSGERAAPNRCTGLELREKSFKRRLGKLRLAQIWRPRVRR